MKILITEHNLAGFLTGVYHAYYTHKDTQMITYDKNNVTMLDEMVEICTDLELARRVRDGIIKKVGELGYKSVADAYLSGNINKEKTIFQYIKLLLKNGKSVFSMYTNDTVIAFNQLVHAVRHENHCLQGYIRFQEMENGIFYAYFGSDNDVLELMLPHFVHRFNSQKFVLHDIQRKKMAYFDGNQYHLTLAPDSFSVLISNQEWQFSRLWKEYHKTIAIDSRKNTNAQRRALPLKYRWFMNEF